MAGLFVLVIAAIVGVDMVLRRHRREPPRESAIITQKVVVDLSRRR
jgi:hypothetical protein